MNQQQQYGVPQATVVGVPQAAAPVAVLGQNVAPVVHYPGAPAPQQVYVVGGGVGAVPVTQQQVVYGTVPVTTKIVYGQPPVNNMYRYQAEAVAAAQHRRAEERRAEAMCEGMMCGACAAVLCAMCLAGGN